MRSYSNRPGIPALGRAIGRSRRWAVRALRSPGVLTVLSWLVWLAIVAAFAAWTLTHYRVPGKTAWIGMTIHTSVFACWLLVARAWLALRLPPPAGPPPGAATKRRG
jgi:hypothetical protein